MKEEQILRWLLGRIPTTELRSFATTHLALKQQTISSNRLIDFIVASKKWSLIIDELGIDELRVCSKCGSLMHEGYCVDMGDSYYCSDKCLHIDYTEKQWEEEYNSNDQSYWTQWFENKDLLDIKSKSMIPIFEEFLYPFVSFLKDGDLTLNEIRAKMVEHFHLSEEDCAETTKGGNDTKFNDRIKWTRQYLSRAKFIESPKRGVYHITPRGLDYISNHATLTRKDLSQYPEFASFFFGNHGDSGADLSKAVKQIEDSDLTPTEQLEQAFASIESDLAADLLNKVMEQSPLFFEHLVVDLLIKMGYGGSFADSACVTQMSNDEGIDGIIYEDKLGLDKIYIQAKRWQNQVGRPVIQQFAGALVGQNATKGVFITTSSYSKEARQYVVGLHQKIVLIDGPQLAKYMIEYNVGVSTKKVYEVKRLDSDYFEE